MSTKAQRVLGVVPDNGQYGVSSHASRQASLYHGQSSMASRRQSTDNMSMLSVVSYHPTFSIVVNNNTTAPLRQAQHARSSKTNLSQQRRQSNSTLRSFAPPVVPTYLPRHMNSSFVPHIAYGKMSQKHTPPIKPPPTPQEQTRTRPPSPEALNSLRKALSKLSLRSNKSRSRFSQLSSPPDVPPAFQHDYSTNAAQSTDQPDMDLFHRTAQPDLSQYASSRNSWRSESLRSTPIPASGHPDFVPRRREWFDVDDRMDDEGLSEPTNESPMVQSNQARHTVSTVKANDVHLQRREARTFGDDAVYRDHTPQVIREEDMPRTHSPKQTQKSVQCEETMFSFNDSDDESDAAPMPQSKPTSKTNPHPRKTSTGTATSGRREGMAHFHQHKRSGSGQIRKPKATTFLYKESSNLAAGNRMRPSLVSLEDDCLTDSLPSLLGSGSSRPTSWFSSALSPPRPLADRKLLEQFEHHMPGEKGAPPTLKEIKRSAPNIVSDLKRGSPGNRIIAAISPEEAILIARIRRNRRSILSQSSPPSPPPSEPAPKPLIALTRRESLMPAAQDRQSRLDFSMRSRSAIPRLQQQKPRTQSQIFINAPPTPSSRHSLRPSLSKPGIKVPLSGPAGEARRARVLSQLITPSTSGAAPEPSLSKFPTPPTPASATPKSGLSRRPTLMTTRGSSFTSEMPPPSAIQHSDSFGPPLTKFTPSRPTHQSKSSGSLLTKCMPSSPTQQSDSSGSPLTILAPSSPAQQSDSSGSHLTKVVPSSPAQQSDSSGSPLTKLSPSRTPPHTRSPAVSPTTSSFSSESDRASRGDVMQALRALGG